METLFWLDATNRNGSRRLAGWRVGGHQYIKAFRVWHQYIDKYAKKQDLAERLLALQSRASEGRPCRDMAISFSEREL